MKSHGGAFLHVGLRINVTSECRDGGIEIADKFSLIEVPAAMADRIIAALKQTTIRGKKVSVRKDRDV